MEKTVREYDNRASPESVRSSVAMTANAFLNVTRSRVDVGSQPEISGQALAGGGPAESAGQSRTVCFRTAGIDAAR